MYNSILKKNKLKKQRIALVCEATGWNKKRVINEMNRIKAMGFNQSEYMRYECWKLSDEEIAALIKRRDNVIEKEALLEDPVYFVCIKTGWETGFAEQKMREAEVLGVSNKQYAKNEMFDLTHEEIVEFSEVLKAQKKREAADRRLYVKIVAERAGWSTEKAKENIKKAKEKGISAFNYARNNCWIYDEEGLELIAKKLSNKTKSKKKTGTTDLYIEKIMEATSWSRAKVRLEVAKAKNICECSYEDYFVFKLYELTPEQQAEYVTFGLFKKMRVRYNDTLIAKAVFDNKVEFNKTYDDCINHKWFYNRDISYDSFLEKIDGIDNILVKPLEATQGKGILKVNCRVSDSDKRALYKRITNQAESIVEEYIIQHDDVMAFCPTSVNTLRITTLNAKGKCNFLYAVFRMGRGAVVDNFHAGGIACAVDLKTGITTTHAVDLDGNVYLENPYSGLKIKGFQIPYWDKIIETCEKIYNRVDGVNLIGWDFAITPDGVDLIEGNTGASYVVAQIPYVQDRIGLRSVMIDDFLMVE